LVRCWKKIQRERQNYGLTNTSELAAARSKRSMPSNYPLLLSDVMNINDALKNELGREAVFHIPPERKGYFEQDELFGPLVMDAFPSCARDIQKAGSCYALEQGDACVHHLMLVLERGLNALAVKLEVNYERTNWQVIIDGVGKKVRSLPGSPDKDVYLEANAQFGFLKDAYRNHAEHARDNPYDIHDALSKLIHIRNFMQGLAKGGLSEKSS